MGRLSAKLRSIETGPDATGVSYYCPGCKEMHAITTHGGAPWTWDGNVDAPTFSPSVLIKTGHFVTGQQGKRCWCHYNAENPTRPAPFVCRVCHCFVRGGLIEFLGDSTHALACQTLPMPDLPEDSA